ncbi:MAG: cupredoxin domain-containing protein [Candidatus Margulisbacteria bacterium]|nr:cupredoxin domain-containing protein [Candidatus Margulisiibacteriota bacterium]MBU1616889.1 cupredoxin domain-containing protein [Candidatus Margulisiibacteriota bacterium]
MAKNVLLAGMIIILSAGVFAAGIKVSPGAFCAQNIEIGKDLDLGVDLTIENSSDSQQSFCLSPIKPSQAKSQWLKGYSEIPDPKWLYMESNWLEVAPRSSGKVRMHLKVPNEEKYLNQHWIVYVNISNEMKKGDLFGVSIKPNYMFETKAAMVKGRPSGRLGFVPSTIKVPIIQGKAITARLILYNNDKRPHTYKVFSFLPPADSGKQEINLSPGYEWAMSEKWIKPLKNKVKIGAGQKKEIELKIAVPKANSTVTRGWESILMVEEEDGLSGFARVLIEPKK